MEKEQIPRDRRRKKEQRDGQILEEGITEAGALASWTAAGDARARGFLLGATAGRTTLNGEGLQHQDGPAPDGPSRRATVLFSGTGYLAAAEARRPLTEQHDVGVELWSVTSYKVTREQALTVERWNRLHPTEEPRVPFVTEALAGAEGPIVPVTDSMKAVPDMVARWVPRPFVPRGTDGYGRSDSRAALRRHFETDAAHVATAVLHGLATAGEAKAREVDDAIDLYGIGPDLPDPRQV